MLSFFKRNISYIAGIILGSIAGYLYYRLVGCDGGCMIASNPFFSTAYGALLGILLVNALSGKTPSKKEA